jgi:type I restriction enzyme S subunit
VTFAPRGGWAIDTAFYIELRQLTETDIRYVYHVLANARLDRQHTTTSIPGLSRDIVCSTPVRLPDVGEQRRIASLLDRAGDLFSRRAKSLALTDDLLRATFLEMFGDPIANPRRFDRLPLSSVATIITGNTPSREDPTNFGGDVEWIKPDNLGLGSHFATAARERLSVTGASHARMAPSGSILVTCIAGSRESIGKCSMLNRPVSFNQQINAIVPMRASEPAYLYGLIFACPEIIRRHSTDSMTSMVSKSRLEAIEVPYPEDADRERFSLVLDRHIVVHRKQAEALAESERLFALLQHRAFQGQL